MEKVCFEALSPKGERFLFQGSQLRAAPQAFHCPPDSRSLYEIATSVRKKKDLKQARFLPVLKDWVSSLLIG
jgi:hypothetical protein